MEIELTDEAVKQMSTMAKQNNEGIVRIGLSGGGCSGFQYAIGFDTSENITDDDVLIREYEDIRFVVDPISLMYLDGSTIRFVNDVMGSHIQIDNPNVQNQCGCGNSVGF